MTIDEHTAAQQAELEALLAAQKEQEDLLLAAQQAIAAALAAQELEDEKLNREE